MDDTQIHELQDKIASATSLQEMLDYVSQLRDRIQALIQHGSNLKATTQDVFKTHIC